MYGVGLNAQVYLLARELSVTLPIVLKVTPEIKYLIDTESLGVT